MTKGFIAERPDVAKRYADAYAQAVEIVRKEPDAVRIYLAGNTAIEKDLAEKVPLPDFKMYNEMTESDLDYFQKFFDVLSDRGVAKSRILVRPDDVQGLSRCTGCARSSALRYCSSSGRAHCG